MSVKNVHALLPPGLRLLHPRVPRFRKSHSSSSLSLFPLLLRFLCKISSQFLKGFSKVAPSSDEGNGSDSQYLGAMTEGAPPSFRQPGTSFCNFVISFVSHQLGRAGACCAVCPATPLFWGPSTGLRRLRYEVYNSIIKKKKTGITATQISTGIR